jgi:hypothetical protein
LNVSISFAEIFKTCEAKNCYFKGNRNATELLGFSAYEKKQWESSGMAFRRLHWRVPSHWRRYDNRVYA